MTDFQDAAAKVAQELQDLRHENQDLRDENQRLRTAGEHLLEELQSIRSAAASAMAERDYYMRECSELAAKFTTFLSICREALDTHRIAPFRPNGAPPKDEAPQIEAKEVEGDPIPQFLTKPPQGNGRRKLQ